MPVSVAGIGTLYKTSGSIGPVVHDAGSEEEAENEEEEGEDKDVGAERSDTDDEDADEDKVDCGSDEEDDMDEADSAEALGGDCANLLEPEAPILRILQVVDHRATGKRINGVAHSIVRVPHGAHPRAIKSQ
jgi:hypothetical protein